MGCTQLPAAVAVMEDDLLQSDEGDDMDAGNVLVRSKLMRCRCGKEEAAGIGAGLISSASAACRAALR